MTTGQVTFNNHKMVRKVLVKERENATVNRLNKTRVEKFPDFRAEKEEYLKTKRKEERKGRDEQRAKEKEEKREREQLKWQKEHAYDDLMSEENMEASNNQDRDPDFLDDFMWPDFTLQYPLLPPKQKKKKSLFGLLAFTYKNKQIGYIIKGFSIDLSSHGRCYRYF